MTTKDRVHPLTRFLFKRHVLPLLKYPVYIQLYAGSVNFGMLHV